MSSQTKVILISGALANKRGHGGEAWVRLSWVLGFQELGFQVHFIEQIAPAAWDAATSAYFETTLRHFGLEHSASLIGDDSSALYGLSPAELEKLAESAHLLVNIGGHLHYPPVFTRVRRKVYVDIDPGFTQFWHAQGNTGARLEGHDFYYTIAENIGQPGCSIPSGDLPWRTTRPPVVLSHWSAPAESGAFEKFTTVASWRGGFGPVEFNGIKYGLKVHEFRKFIGLPARVSERFEIALNIYPGDGGDLSSLVEHGWQIVDPAALAVDTHAFRAYLQSSSAEFSVAQGIYVQTNSGWFSDRTAHYLASGKPVLVQDTGFSRNLPCGDGLIAFTTLDEAVAGAKRIAGDYSHHCKAARGIAENYFDSKKVLGKLLGEVEAAL